MPVPQWERADVEIDGLRLRYPGARGEAAWALDGLSLHLRAGERVALEIPTIESQSEALVLPFNAVLHDIHGGQWVYARTGDHSYTRRRIQVARVAGSDAILSSGPPAGTMVVTDGSAELFGTEFVTGK